MAYDINGTTIYHSEVVADYLATYVFRSDMSNVPADIHDTCLDAQDWCETASNNEVYEHDMFTIKVVDD